MAFANPGNGGIAGNTDRFTAKTVIFVLETAVEGANSWKYAQYDRYLL
jgi:hypothetical protein